MCWCRLLQRKLLGGRVWVRLCRPLAAAALRLMALWATCGRPGRLRPAGNGGRWLGMVVSDTLAGYVSKEGDVNVR